jgi:hypothetical protein
MALGRIAVRAMNLRPKIQCGITVSDIAERVRAGMPGSSANGARHDSSRLSFREHENGLPFHGFPSHLKNSSAFL